MNTENTVTAETRLAHIAAVIAEPSRARMLCSLLDGHARTATELSVVAEVSPSTASVHLAKLMQQNLLKLVAQGKHRYYQLADAQVAAALEALLVLAGAPRPRFVPNTPTRLRLARTCYDHMAGSVAVQLHDVMLARGWLQAQSPEQSAYELSQDGKLALENLGLDLTPARQSRRRFACACLDWSERKPHLGGALGAALLDLLLKRAWVVRDLDSRALGITAAGSRGLKKLFDIPL